MSSQGLRESEAPARAQVRFLGSQRVQSGSEGVWEADQGLKESEGSVGE